MKWLITLKIALVVLFLSKAPVIGGDDPKAKPPQPAPAAPGPVVDDNMLRVRRCRIEYNELTRLSSSQTSLLQSLDVGLGERVKAGQVLARLFDEDVRPLLDQYQAKAESDISVNLAKTDLILAQNKLKKTQKLQNRSFESAEVLLEDQYTYERAQIAVASAEMEKKLALTEKKRVEGELRSRQLVAPHDGVIVEILKNQGESVVLGDPLIKIVNPNRLKVWGSINVPDLWKIKVGQPVQVVPDIPGVDLDIEHKAFEGQVVFISNEIDPSTQTCQILAIVENRDEQLRGGLMANMNIKLVEGKPIAKANFPKTTSPAPAPATVLESADSSTGGGASRRARPNP